MGEISPSARERLLYQEGLGPAHALGHNVPDRLAAPLVVEELGSQALRRGRTSQCAGFRLESAFGRHWAGMPIRLWVIGQPAARAHTQAETCISSTQIVASDLLWIALSSPLCVSRAPTSETRGWNEVGSTGIAMVQASCGHRSAIVCSRRGSGTQLFALRQGLGI